MTRFLGTLACWLMATVAQAGILTPGMWGALQLANNTPPPFYDQGSEDGAAASFAHYLNGISPTLEVLGGDRRFYTDQTSHPLTGTFTLLSEWGDFAEGNQFGWHDVDGPSWGVIFWGSDTAGTTRSVTLPASAGFWVLNPLGNLFTTLGTADHFLLARSVSTFSTTYWLGYEDLQRPKVFDWNDGIVSFWTAKEVPPTVPEPGTLTLLGLGLLGIARKAVRRGRDKNTSLTEEGQGV